MRPTSIISRILDGLERVSLTLRADQWGAADAGDIYPTQHQILCFLARRHGRPVRLKEVAAHLGVAGPTATGSVNALERKGLVEKRPHSDDARAVALSLSDAGRQALARARREETATAAALARLSPDEQGDLLLLLVKLIRNLQIAGAIPPQRVCVTCKYFRPFAHDDPGAPHHCDFVNAAFGDAQLRVDCGDHETAEPGVQAATWARFQSGLRASEGATKEGDQK